MENSTVQKRSKFSKMLRSIELRRGIIAIFVFLIIWQFGALIDDWTGYDMIGIGLVPPPIDVLITWADVIPNLGYWQSWVSVSSVFWLVSLSLCLWVFRLDFYWL